MKIRLKEADYIRPGTVPGSVHDVDDETGKRLIERGVAEDVEAEDTRSAEPSDEWTNDQLREYAEKHEIDVSGAGKKAELLDKINAARQNEGGGR